MINFPLIKSSQQSKAARHGKTPMKSNVVSIGYYVLLFLLDFPQTEIACRNSMLVKSSRTVPRELYWENCVYIIVF